MTSSPSTIKPHLALTVGVTGHRLHRLQSADLAALRAAVDATLANINTTLNAEQRKYQKLVAAVPVQIRMISALADGADTIVAQSALAAGWRVDACLPFQCEVYASDFAQGHVHDEFVDLLARMTAVFELNGEHAEQEHRNAAYEAVGRLVLEQSDILLALWDGDPARGRGETSRIVAEAVARHLPVIHIHTLGLAAPELLWTGLSDAEIEQPSVEIVPRIDVDKGISIVVEALTISPDNKIDRRMLAQFYRERVAKNTPALPYPLLLAATGVRNFSWRDLRPTSAQESAAGLTAPQHSATGTHDPASALVHRYGVADSSAAYFAQIFRSGFVANFSMAAIAVVLALSGLLASALKLPIISAELVCVILILVNTQAGIRFGWHERWMDNRRLAEQLRALAFTSLLGDRGLRAHGSGDAAAIPRWVGWLTRATAREIGLANVHANTEYLTRVRDTAIGLIDDQIGYQRSNALRMHKLEHRLHITGQVLFGGTIVACVFWITAKLTGMPMGLVGTVGVTEIVTVLTAILPALGASIYGIRMQGDFAGVAYRSQVTVTRLERLKRAMQSDPVHYARLSSRLRNLADIMLSDVANWRTTHQARPLALLG